MILKIRSRLKYVLYNQSGDLAEELLIFPLKILLFVMLFEFSLLLINYQMFLEAYGTCMRMAEIRGGVDEVVSDAVKAHLQTMPNSIDPEDVLVLGTPPEVPFGGIIEVEMQYVYEFQLVDHLMNVLDQQIIFNPTGFTTSSKIVRQDM